MRGRRDPRPALQNLMRTGDVNSYRAVTRVDARDQESRRITPPGFAGAGFRGECDATGACALGGRCMAAGVRPAVRSASSRTRPQVASRARPARMLRTCPDRVHRDEHGLGDLLDAEHIVDVPRTSSSSAVKGSITTPPWSGAGFEGASCSGRVRRRRIVETRSSARHWPGGAAGPQRVRRLRARGPRGIVCERLS